jgi:hypothetical protein
MVSCDTAYSNQNTGNPYSMRFGAPGGSPKMTGGWVAARFSGSSAAAHHHVIFPRSSESQLARLRGLALIPL